MGFSQECFFKLRTDGQSTTASRSPAMKEVPADSHAHADKKYLGSAILKAAPSVKADGTRKIFVCLQGVATMSSTTKPKLKTGVTFAEEQAQVHFVPNPMGEQVMQMTANNVLNLNKTGKVFRKRLPGDSAPMWSQYPSETKIKYKAPGRQAHNRLEQLAVPVQHRQCCGYTTRVGNPLI